MIDWVSLGVVALASLVAASTVVALFALGLRLRPASGFRSGRGAAAIACFALCGVAVLYGIYLIVPALHGG